MESLSCTSERAVTAICWRVCNASSMAQSSLLSFAVMPSAGVEYHVPFGGRKGSSYGPREQGRYAAEFYTAVKTAYVNP